MPRPTQSLKLIPYPFVGVNLDCLAFLADPGGNQQRLAMTASTSPPYRAEPYLTSTASKNLDTPQPNPRLP